MTEGDHSSVIFNDTFKPPDRSTSAPPVLSLNSESLFAFRAAEHLHLFSDIRCEENYMEFYKKYEKQTILPPPLESQPFLVDRSNVLEDDLFQPGQFPFDQRLSVSSEARSMPPVRSNSNPQYVRQGSMFDGYDGYGPSHLDEIPNGSPTNESIWTPLPRKMANLVLDDFTLDDKPEERAPMPQHMPPQHPQLPQNTAQPFARRDPYYHNEFDVPYNSNQRLKDEGIQSLWNDNTRTFERPPQNFRPPNAAITAPTPTVPTAPSPLLSLLNNNHAGTVDHLSYFPDSTSPRSSMDAGVPKTSPRRRASSGSRAMLVPPQRTITPPSSSSSSSLQPQPAQPAQSTPICRYFAQGYCSRGDRCNFLHEADPNHPQFAAGSAQDKAVDGSYGKNKSKKSVASPPMPIGVPPMGAQVVDLKKAARRANGELVSNGTSAKPSDIITNRQYTQIEHVIGHIYPLCKDQHGCRFLQKKLEEKDPKVVELIFNEVYDHMTELMTDPFGNYLCQKLLEFCTDDQRYAIIERVGSDLVKISKNMHGTRAVQKMIEFLTTPEQISLVKRALANHVVTLIQDLNGNHVIQRCLNKLPPQDNQFIYDSVSQTGHCVEVATHRHGCCVLQRCIDHASESQKMQLIGEIIANALVLVQDPYGNYVVQYVLDLPYQGVASELAMRFIGHVPILSTQKFSSNVIEKCLNVANLPTRAAIIQEIIEYDNLLYLLQDPYANYVIQTALSVSEPVQHARLVEAIRPHLTALRNTPYGKRIQNKILKEGQRDYYQ